jgi:hypothetical protein
MFRTTKQLVDHELRLATLSLAVAELRRDMERRTDTKILALIEQLQNDVDFCRQSLRSVHGKLAIAKRYEAPKPADDEPGDDEFKALLDLQRAGSSN